MGSISPLRKSALPQLLLIVCRRLFRQLTHFASYKQNPLSLTVSNQGKGANV